MFIRSFTAPLLSRNIANLEMRYWRRNIMSAFGAR
jgi:hypothetical protein